MLQFIPVSAIVWLVTACTLAAGTFCETSNKPWFAHIWVRRHLYLYAFPNLVAYGYQVQVVKVISTVLAIVGVIRFYGIKKRQLAPYKVMLKLMAFKGIIAVNLIQTVGGIRKVPSPNSS